MLRSTPRPAIRLRGVRHNNLKHFDLDLPLGELIVVTGPSGSGKSSLAFDTLFAEGQRRYIETFSPYARQFFDRMDKPQVDAIEGIPPAIAIEQRNSVRTPRSTVGTMTEVCEHMKLVWPRFARLHCRRCDQVVETEPPQRVWEKVLATWSLQPSSIVPALITFELPLAEKLSLEESLELVGAQGYQRLLHRGEIVRVEDAAPRLRGHGATSITVVQDRLRVEASQRARFIEACEQAYHFGKGKIRVWALPDASASAGVPLEVRDSLAFSLGFHCATCDLDYQPPTSALFSFNHPLGACAHCKGFGRLITIDYNLAIPDPSRSLAEGAIKPWLTGQGAESLDDMRRFAKIRRVPMSVPFRDLSPEHQKWVIDGDPDYGKDAEHEWPRAWYGLKGYFRWLESKAYRMHVRVLLSRYRAYSTCPECRGKRFQPDSLLYQWTRPSGPALPASIPERLSLADFYQLPIHHSLELAQRCLETLVLAPTDPLHLVLREVAGRLSYLAQVGLGFLTLDRPTRSLSGGETERVNLTTCLGSRLVNTLFVLDEPTVGLHARDTARLVRVLHRLRDAGNTVVVVEHEAAVMREADRIVDLGPGQGETGGHVVFEGPYAELLECRASVTGRYLSGVERQEPRRRRSTSVHRKLALSNASCHNIRNLDLEIPLGRLVCVTGVSGSGKTTLVRDLLLPALQARLASAAKNPAPEPDQTGPSEAGDSEVHDGQSASGMSLRGWESLGQVILVDQSALGRTPRSNPAVYIGAFEEIRQLFAMTSHAIQRDMNASAFSFNSARGQCERCRGAGHEKIEMQFLSDVFVRCPECDGRRYRPHILEITLGRPGSPQSEPGWSIASFLEATVDEAIAFLEAFPEERAAVRANQSLKLLKSVGLGYLRLGQPINTLSGGESQRLKLVGHLAESLAARNTSAKPALFLLDEPTTGLHFDDVRILLKTFNHLVDLGHSLLVIEHNLDVVRASDWVIDLGPEAGEQGGRIVAQGPPAVITAARGSHTGAALRGDFEDEAARTRRNRPGVATGLLIEDRAMPVENRRISTRADAIQIYGAREHNLKNLTLEIPRGKFVVITGVSGSGKSTLAFDLLFAEGQRRFLDSMNTYARQFVEQLARPDVDLITGIPPTVSIEQRISRGGGKSTVATVTEIYHFLRLLFARLGTQYCPECQLPVTPQTRDQLIGTLRRELRLRGDLLLLAPMIRGRKGHHSDVAQWAAQHGYGEIRADGRMYNTSKPFRLDRFKEHNVEIVIGVIEKKKGADSGLSLRGMIEEALDVGRGAVFALDNSKTVSIHSTQRACPKCWRSYEPLDPRLFSFNSSQGWCPKCRGFGELFYLPDVDRGARADAIEESWFGWQEGNREPCPECGGARLNAIARAVRLDILNTSAKGRSSPRSKASEAASAEPSPTIDTFAQMPVGKALEFVSAIRLTGRGAVIARDILPEIQERLKFLDRVGLEYLALGRGVTTLSGGESQRIRLAAQLGSNLSGVLYILDEPTIGLHARDNDRLLDAVGLLRSRGNSVVVVEHDEETMRRADHIIDLGPGAGVHGGRVVASGSLEELMRHPDSITGACLQQKRSYPSRGQRRPTAPGSRLTRPGVQPELVLKSVGTHNLKDITVTIPLSRLVVVTGVSGSGKSTLILESLLPALKEHLDPKHKGRKSDGLSGYESLDAVYEVDQSPIGRTPRSIPATYVGFFDDIRSLFAQTPEARLRGYTASRFSFNSKQGRCPECEGAGTVKLEMNFLPPAYVRCESCNGRRFNAETLDVQYGGKNIADVLDLSVDEAAEFFDALPSIRRPLHALHETGLGYLKLGQTSPTLSGGEAQRVKLVTHLLAGIRPGPSRLRRRASQHCFILEEPTIGLHFLDVQRLLGVLHQLIDAGHSVIVIEHNLDLIADADWIIDLGPEGGEGGGRIVAEGTPEQVAQEPGSHTGRYLRKILSQSLSATPSG